MNHVTFEIHEKERVGVLTMTFKAENRLNPDVLAEMSQVLDEAENNKAVGAVIITGGGPKFFSNGLDLEWIMINISKPEAIAGYLKTLCDVYRRVTLYPKPVIAAINGHTFGGGFFLAAHCDFRLMREDRGWICLPEIDVNIPLLPGMVAICKAVMPPQSFRKMYYTGKRFTGPEALAMGFADGVFSEQDLLPKSIEFAAELATKKTRTYAEMKRRIREDIARIIDEEDPKSFMPTLSFSMPG